jgi:nucleoside-diphosphate-sugar epimerase
MIVITGSQGNIGRRLSGAWPDVIGIDRAGDAAIRADLARDDLLSGPVADALSRAGAVIHLAACADPEAPPQVHLDAALATARLVAACAAVAVPRLILASSDWAAPAPPLDLNPYGQSKRVAEAFATIYDALPGCSGVAIRVGWVPGDPGDVAKAPGWLRAVHWTDERLIAAFATALR